MKVVITRPTPAELWLAAALVLAGVPVVLRG